MTKTPTPRAGDDRAFHQQRAAVRTRELTTLMARRPDLWGVHPAADLAAEAVSWSV